MLAYYSLLKYFSALGWLFVIQQSRPASVELLWGCWFQPSSFLESRGVTRVPYIEWAKEKPLRWQLFFFVCAFVVHQERRASSWPADGDRLCDRHLSHWFVQLLLSRCTRRVRLKSQTSRRVGNFFFKVEVISPILNSLNVPICPGCVLRWVSFYCWAEN